MLNRDKLIALHLEGLDELGWKPAPIRDAIDQRARLDLLDSDEAGIVCGRDASTAARWAQAAEDEGTPIAIKPGSWLFVTSRLLDYIEHKSGLPARREAETRHRKLLEMRARSQRSTSDARPRAVSTGNPCDYADSKLAFDDADQE